MNDKEKIKPMVSVRIVSADYYMSNPIANLDIGYSVYRGLEVKRVPVIRIFGSTSTGYKVCLHVHGVFPYFYVPYDGSVPSDRMGHQMVMALDKALNVLQGQGMSNAHHIFKVSLISGVPIYGFHRKEHQLFKVFFYNPVTRKHSYDLLLNGAVMHKILQPYEAHIPFILQFLIDFNLQGMNYVHLKSASSRRTPAAAANEFYPNKTEPTSTCEMELDCSAGDILNLLETKNGIQMNPGLAALWDEEIERRRVKNMNVNNIGPPSSQTRTDAKPSASHTFYKNTLEQQIASIVKEDGNTSLTFYEVNEQMETTLPIETPEEVQDVLTASMIDFHATSTTGVRPRPITPSISDDLDLLDILCDLADEHGTSILESSHIDEDSILGTQSSRTSQPISCSIHIPSSEDNAVQSDDDDDRETMEMSQIFHFDDSAGTEADECVPGPSSGILWAGHVPVASGEIEGQSDSSNSTLTDLTLPNLDGAHDSSSDDAGESRSSRRKSRTYKPLAFRSVHSANQSKLNISAASSSTDKSISVPHLFPENEVVETSLLSISDVMAEIDSSIVVQETPHRRERIINRQNDEYVDALYQMSLLSPSEVEQRESPPRPGTPTDCSVAQVIIRPLLEDIACYERSSGKKLHFNSGRVVLKRLAEEVEEYQLKSRRKLHLSPQAKLEVTTAAEKMTVIRPKKRRIFPISSSLPEPVTSSSPALIRRKEPRRQDLQPLPIDAEESKPSFLIPTPDPDSSDLFGMDSAAASTSPDMSVPAGKQNIFLPGTRYVPTIPPPSRDHVLSTLDFFGIDSAVNGAPHWGDPKDQVKIKDVKGKSLHIASQLVSSLPEFKTSLDRKTDAKCDLYKRIILTPLKQPPSAASVGEWLQEKRDKEQAAAALAIASRPPNDAKLSTSQLKHDRSQLEAVTLNNSFGFRVSIGNCQEAKAVHQYQYLTVMSMELHARARESLRPDPEFDPIEAIFYSLTNDVPVESPLPDVVHGAIVVQSSPEDGPSLFTRSGVVMNADLKLVESERALFQEFIALIHHWNPDIVLGYEIEMLSWGYLLTRGTHLGLPIADKLSRIVVGHDRQTATMATMPDDIIEGGYMAEKNSDIAIGGRIVLNLWRLLRFEIAVQSYTFENMAFHILHRRVANFAFEKLNDWWKSNHSRWQVIEHYTTRVRGNLELLERLDLIGRTSELARLFGIQFYEVFTRGSQFRVESMMLRLAKPKNFVAVSPSVTQRSRMKAPEWLPLILEPESRFYTDPVLVLDFQSLYPSVIIAYNYCYSTCLGRTQGLGRNEPFDFGCTQLLIPPDIVRDLVAKDLVNISPAGVVFVKPEVKQSMKEYPGDNTLRRVFDSRQLGLKLIANVTYGYTSANFSGRMPCVEVGDSVVSKGRETLEGAIRLIESRPEWKARVVYGDTDSVFVLLPGRSKSQAFKIGEEISEAVTRMNPQPIKLKFEKVYLPCILQTKKRYVGYKYESVDQKEPVYEAKGIETVRRDGCPAVVKILERSLRVLFETYDVSKVKAYTQRQFSKIMQNRVSIQDYIFAKEYRGRGGYKPGAVVPGLEISKQLARIDRRAEPRSGERVPYIVVYGSPGVPLIRLVVPAHQLLNDPSLRLNAHYYISRVIIPALQRCFGLLGVDVLSWYQSLPRISTVTVHSAASSEYQTRKATISQYFGTNTCLICDEPIHRHGLCLACCNRPQRTAYSVSSMLRLREKDYSELMELCRSCTGTVAFGRDCLSMDCPVLYRRTRAFHNLQSIHKLNETLAML